MQEHVIYFFWKLHFYTLSTTRSYLNNDEFVLCIVEIMKLLSKTQSHSWVWSRKLTILVKLQSCNTQSL